MGLAYVCNPNPPTEIERILNDAIKRYCNQAAAWCNPYHWWVCRHEVPVCREGCPGGGEMEIACDYEDYPHHCPHCGRIVYFEIIDDCFYCPECGQEITDDDESGSDDIYI